MRIAIVVTGQPRFFEQGAWWLRNKVFPIGSGIQAEYFCHFWNDGSLNLEDRVKEAYGTDNVVIEDFDSQINNHMGFIQEQNEKYDDWTGIPSNYQENMLFNTPGVTTYGKNWHGQYLSAGRATEIWSEEFLDYSIVIKTRSDCVMNNMSIQEWLHAFGNMHRNPQLSNMLYANWLYVKAGLPYHGDFVFVGRPEIWNQYGKSIIPGLRTLCTRDKFYFREINETDDSYVSHWAWNKINVYSKNDWLSFTTTWPTSFNSALIRKDNFVYDKDFKTIFDTYLEMQ